MVYRPSDVASDPAILDLGGPNLGSPQGRTKLSAIFAADVEGYSRLMGFDEVGTLRTLTAYRVIVDHLIASHHFGDAVNVAARLEALAEPGGICVSRVVRDQVRDKPPYRFEDMGEQSVKNIARPVRVYALSKGMAALPLASFYSPPTSQRVG